MNDVQLLSSTLPVRRAASALTEYRAVAGMFLLNGVLFASWASEIPVLRQRLGLSDLVLSVALAGITLGSVLVLPLISRRLDRAGAAGVGLLGVLGAGAALFLATQAPNAALFILALLAFGAGFGALDAAMNAAGLEVEERLRRPVMSGLHGGFSIGALLGALLGGWLIGQGVGPGSHLLGVALLTLLVAGLLFPLLPSSRGALPEGSTPEPAPTGAPAPELPAVSRTDRPERLRGPLAALSLLAFCAALGEGAVSDWAGVYLQGAAGSMAAQAALGFAGFSLAMTLGRLCGDRLTLRFGAAALGHAGGLIAVAGLTLALAVPTLGTAVLGFSLMGLGLSVLAPLAFSAVGWFSPAHRAAALASVAGAFRLGYLVGPLLIGALALPFSVRGALVLVLLLTILATLLTRRLPTPAAFTVTGMTATPGLDSR